MKKLLTSTWMIVVVSGLIYLGATVAFWKTPVHARELEPSGVSAAQTFHGPSWEFVNPEADQLMAELKAEKKSLEKREQDLNDLSSRLQSERSELNVATDAVKKLQSEYDQSVLRIKEEETANLKKLAKIYSAMAGDSAANIFAELDDVSIVKIMVFMKDGDTAAILEALAKKSSTDAKRAAGLSERIRLASFRNNPTTK